MMRSERSWWWRGEGERWMILAMAGTLGFHVSGCCCRPDAVRNDSPGATMNEQATAGAQIDGEPAALAIDTTSWPTVQSALGTYHVAYELTPNPIPLNEPFTMRVSVTTPESQPIDVGIALRLHVDARMPQHRHGMTVMPRVERDSSTGLFLVSGMLFHMPGRWELSFDVTQGARTERAQVVVMLE